MKIERWSYRIARWSGWLLVPVTLVDLLSGYALVHRQILGGILGGALAFRLHIVAQPAFVALFVVHVVPYARQALRAWRIPDLVATAILFVLGGALVAVAAYLGIVT